MALCPQINALYYEAKRFFGIESSEGQKVKHGVMNQYSFLYFDQQDTLENHCTNVIGCQNNAAVHGLESFQFL